MFGFFSGAASMAVVSILILFYLDRGLSLGQIMLLMSTFVFSLLIFEIPTGVVADRYSRKWSLAIGALLQVVVGVIILSTAYLPILFGAHVLVGLGAAFLSGAGEALIYDFLKQESREGDAQRVFGAGLSWDLIGGVVGAILAGLLVARFELAAAVWAHNALYISAAVVALWLDELTVQNHDSEGASAASIRSQLARLLADTRASFGIIIESRAVKALIAVGLTIGVVSFLAEITFSQPYLVGFGLRPEHVAYAAAAFSAAAAVSAALSNRLSEILHGDERRFMLIVLSMLVVGLVMMVNASAAVVAIASLILIFIVAGGLAPPFLDTGVNRRIPSEHRASVLSIRSMAFGLLSFFLPPLFGFLADGYSLETSLDVFQWTFLPLVGVVVLAAWFGLRPAVADHDVAVRRVGTD